MTMEIWSETPEIDGYSRRDILPVTVFKFAGAGAEQRAALQSLARREYTITIHRTKTQAATVDTHFRTVNWSVTSFLFKDPDDYARTGISLGTSVSGQTLFNLPATGEYTRDYPVNDANVVVYDDGVAVSVVSADPDNRTITVSVAPTSGSVMTADYYYYRRVRLLEGPVWSKLAPDWMEGTVKLLEVIE